jgi:hypothetical protein
LGGFDRVSKDSIGEHGYFQPSSNHDADREMVELAVRNTNGMPVSLSSYALPDFRNEHVGVETDEFRTYN